MKLFFSFFLFSLATTTFATVDSNTRVFILIRHVQSGEYAIERAPLVGCYGMPKGPELVQLTTPYVVGNLGCGMNGSEDINALSCAKTLDFKESEDASTYKEITLDISNCVDKTNPEFIQGIKKVVKINFATRTVKNPVVKIYDNTLPLQTSTSAFIK